MVMSRLSTIFGGLVYLYCYYNNSWLSLVYLYWYYKLYWYLYWYLYLSKFWSCNIPGTANVTVKQIKSWLGVTLFYRVVFLR